MLSGQYKENITAGAIVEVIQKHHQKLGHLTQGTVKRLLTKSKFHSHGIKVELIGGVVGRVKNVLNK